MEELKNEIQIIRELMGELETMLNFMEDKDLIESYPIHKSETIKEHIEVYFDNTAEIKEAMDRIVADYGQMTLGEVTSKINE